MEVHNRTRYEAGCRCDRCRKAQSDYRKDLRLRSKARVPAGTRSTLKSVPALPSSYARSKPGRVESAVLAEIEGLTTAVNARRLLRARGRWRGCCSPLSVAQHPQAMARMQSALDQLRRAHVSDQQSQPHRSTEPVASGRALGTAWHATKQPQRVQHCCDEQIRRKPATEQPQPPLREPI